MLGFLSTSKRSICLFLAFCGAGILASTALATPPPELKPPQEETSTKYAEATFAGGCFWCMEKPFDKLGGVKSTVSGYIGGDKQSANYKAVSAGRTQHYEALQVTYDPKRVSYAELLDVFWVNIDPVDRRGQFCDKGPQYRSAIFYQNASEQRLAVASKQQAAVKMKVDGIIATPIIKATTFYPAESYHQNYYKKNPLRYRYYRKSCGRDKRLKAVWGER